MLQSYEESGTHITDGGLQAHLATLEIIRVESSKS